MKNLFVIAGLLFVLTSSCGQKDRNTLEGNVETLTIAISGQMLNHEAKQATLSFIPLHHLVEPEKYTATIDEKGNFSFSIPATKENYAQLKIGKQSIRLFLKPGDRLAIQADAKNFENSLSFAGEDTQAQKFIYLSDSLRNAMIYSDAKKVFSKPLAAFTAHVNQWESASLKVLDSLIQENEHPVFRAAAEAQLQSVRINLFKNYAPYHSYFTGSEAQQEPPLEEYYSQIEAGNTGSLRSPSYRQILLRWVALKAKNSLEEAEALPKEWVEKTVKVHQKALEITQQNYKNETKEYLSAALCLEYINNLGIKELKDSDTLLQNYYKLYAKSSYKPYVEQAAKRFLALKTGQPAPDFAYANREGQQVALSDFKGKLVYIDVWATWCGPCIGQMPYAAELKEKFKDADDVVFMYVSVDENKEKWENYLTENPDFSGVQLWANGWSEIAQNYMISGIPRYILVGKDGTLIDAHAPRPSSGEEIEQLIEENRQEIQARS